MHGKAYGLSLVGKGTLDRLLDPPCSIGTELAALGGVESLNCFDQPNIAFANQVEDGQSKIVVVIGNFNDETKVGRDHFLASCLFSSEFVWRGRVLLVV